MHYTVALRTPPPALDNDWDDPAWGGVEPLSVDHFRPEGSDHQPTTRVRLAHSETALHLIFRVEDRYVRCVHTGLHAPVCRDSCVEFFVEPRPGKGYFNFEFNCGGAMLLYFVEDPTRPDRHSDMRKRTAVTPEQAATVLRHASLPETVEQEITEPTTWTLSATISLKLLEDYLGPLGDLAGQTWRGNFYKCGDDTSYPHWASWSPVTGNLNFHKPECFGELRFAE
jgi:hypothetical protein